MDIDVYRVLKRVLFDREYIVWRRSSVEIGTAPNVNKKGVGKNATPHVVVVQDQTHDESAKEKRDYNEFINGRRMCLSGCLGWERLQREKKKRWRTPLSFMQLNIAWQTSNSIVLGLFLFQTKIEKGHRDIISERKREGHGRALSSCVRSLATSNGMLNFFKKQPKTVSAAAPFHTHPKCYY